MDVDKKIRLNWGIALTLVIAIIPMFAWKFGYTFEESETWRIVAFSFAKIGAFGGMTMFALSLILSGRYSWYDKLFGGLDKMYTAHRFLGTFSLLLLFVHPLSLSILSLETGFSSSLSLWFKVSDFGVWLGALAFYALFGLIIWTIFARSKYEIFVKVHRMLGVVFILGATHAFMAGSILASNQFMFWYMFVLTLAGSFTFIAYSLLGDILHRPMKYKLVKTQKFAGDIIELHLKPSRRIINFTPGQFVYVQFEGLESHGYHPFSVRSSKRSSTLKLAIRKAGDFTEALQDVEIGRRLKIKGPYGGFLLELNTKKKQLWVAGGIGVTPFLSGAESLRHTRRQRGGDIEMIYSSVDKKPYGYEELLTVEERNDIFNVTLLENQKFGHINLELIQSQIKDLAHRDIFVCGPPAMLKSFEQEAERLGLANNLHFEEFSY